MIWYYMIFYLRFRFLVFKHESVYSTTLYCLGVEDYFMYLLWNKGDTFEFNELNSTVVSNSNTLVPQHVDSLRIITILSMDNWKDFNTLARNLNSFALICVNKVTIDSKKYCNRINEKNGCSNKVVTSQTSQSFFIG